MKLKDIEYNILRKQREKINALKKQNEKLQREKKELSELLVQFLFLEYGMVGFIKKTDYEKVKENILINIKRLLNEIKE